MLAGQALITGDSSMVTVNEQLDEPHVLFAVQITVVVPIAKMAPDAGEQVTVAAGDPVEVGLVQVAMWLSHWLILAGQALITGDSSMVTENEQLEDPQELVAVQVTVVVPVMKVEPETGAQETVAAGDPVAVGLIQFATWLSH